MDQDAPTPPSNALELRVFGLQRSGNHAIIDWIVAQHRGGRIAFLNNVRHGDHDPYTTARESLFFGFGMSPRVEQVRAAPKALLVYSYEDDRKMLRPRRSLLESARDADFERHRERYLGSSAKRLDVVIVRDPFNFFASRIKKLNSLTGVRDLAWIAASWKQLAHEAVRIAEQAPAGMLFVNYDEWFASEAYRRSLSARLGGRFSDSSLKAVPTFGAGSSFDATRFGKLSFRMIRGRLHRLKDPRAYVRYLKRLVAPGGDKMKVLERWKAMRADPDFRTVLADRDLLALSARLFGELPGTTEFVRDLPMGPRTVAGESAAEVDAR